MDSHRSSRDSSQRRWRSLVEQYTPDGALGRFLLGGSTGMAGIWLLALLLFEIPRWGLSLAALFWAPVLFGTGLPAVLVSLVVLWPLYLSLIGNIESADAYSVGDASGRTTTTEPETAQRAVDTSGDSSGEPDSDDPFADLKRQYANGDISESEFERYVESRLDGGTATSVITNASDDRTRERTPERN